LSTSGGAGRGRGLSASQEFTTEKEKGFSSTNVFDALADEEEAGSSSDKVHDKEASSATEDAEETPRESPAPTDEEDDTNEDEEEVSPPAITPAPPSPTQVVASITRHPLAGDELKRKIKASLDEYKDSEETEDAADLVRGQSDEVVSNLIQAIVQAATEGKDRDRVIFPKLLDALIDKHKVVETKHLELGVTALAENLDEVVMDSPNAPKFLAAFLVVAVKLKALPIETLPALLSKCSMGLNAAKVGSAVFLELAKDLGEEEGKKLAKTVDFNLFFDAEGRDANAEKFLSRNSDIRALLS
jgi:hypothetical protein